MKSMLSILGALLSLSGVYVLLSTVGSVPSSARIPVPDTDNFPEANVLVFSKTVEFYHTSIPAGLRAVLLLGVEHDFTVDTTTNAAVFSDVTLQKYDAVVFLNTTGDVLNTEQEEAFARYIRAGGGYAGIHSASDTEYEWPWYGQLVGAYFVNHPAIQEASLSVVDRDHGATKHLPQVWTRTDEWYNLRYVNEDVHLLLTLDESTYLQSDGEPGSKDHAMAWYHESGEGRAFYTALGHTAGSYSEPAFLQHILGGIEYAMGRDYRSDS